MSLLEEVVFNTSPLLPKVLIPVSAILAIVFALYLTTITAKVQVKKPSGGSVRTENGREYLLQVFSCSHRSIIALCQKYWKLFVSLNSGVLQLT